jgi:hypothetical protein
MGGTESTLPGGCPGDQATASPDAPWDRAKLLVLRNSTSLGSLGRLLEDGGSPFVISGRMLYPSWGRWSETAVRKAFTMASQLLQNPTLGLRSRRDDRSTRTETLSLIAACVAAASRARQASLTRIP